jgi:pantoate--beta-alanine ligase
MALLEAAKSIRTGKSPDRATAAARRKLQSLGFKVDYVAARNAQTLARVKSASEPMRLLAAVRLGKTRLIDNVPA